MARGKKKNGLSVNFKGVEIGKRGRIPEDDYLMEVVAVEEHESDKNDGIKWTFEIAEGPHKGWRGYQYTMLNPDSLWKLGALLQALGHEVPDDEMDLDPLDQFEGDTIMGVVADEVYNGEKRSKMVDFFPVDEEREKKDDEKPSGRRRRSERDADDEGSRSRGSRRSRDKDDEDEKPRGRGRKKDEEEFEPIPSEDVQEMDEDELADVIKRADLDVDLDDYKTLRKQRAAVIDALEAADLIEGAAADEPEKDDRPSRRSRSSKDEDEGSSRRSSRSRSSKDDDDEESAEDRKKRLRRERRERRK